MFPLLCALTWLHCSQHTSWSSEKRDFCAALSFPELYEHNGNNNSSLDIIGLTIWRLVSQRTLNYIPSHLVRAAAMNSPSTTGTNIIVVINCRIRITGSLWKPSLTVSWIATLVSQNLLFKQNHFISSCMCWKKKINVRFWWLTSIFFFPIFMETNTHMWHNLPQTCSWLHWYSSSRWSRLEFVCNFSKCMSHMLPSLLHMHLRK